jgi:hypothetical protein
MFEQKVSPYKQTLSNNLGSYKHSYDSGVSKTNRSAAIYTKGRKWLINTADEVGSINLSKHKGSIEARQGVLKMDHKIKKYNLNTHQSNVYSNPIEGFLNFYSKSKKSHSKSKKVLLLLIQAIYPNPCTKHCSSSHYSEQ